MAVWPKGAVAVTVPVLAMAPAFTSAWVVM